MTPTPETVAQHGLTPDEYTRICGHLGRPPNLLELGIFSVLWSEHCSYKSSRVYLKQFPTTGPQVLVGPGENAGVVDLGDGDALAFKMESHNHPSYIEPYQGAATGVGGILRDVFTMGARPIASLNSLRFGAPEHPRTAWLVRGVVAGIGGYGNCIGVPTVGGEVAFDASYNGNCLVNAFTAGILRADRIFKGTASGVGNPLIYVGSKTGRDGIHGATMASASFDETAEEKRPTVQVGDPFTEKLLLEACLELFATDALVGIQDMGAAGLTSSSIEMAGRAGSGIEIDVSRVPCRESGISAYDIMLSESQERMVLVAKAGREQEVLDIFKRWDLDAAVIGRVTDTGHVVVLEAGAIAADIPIAPLTDGAPVYQRPVQRPTWLDDLQRFDTTGLPPIPVARALESLLTSPNLTSRAWVYRQYDTQVRLGGLKLPGAADAAVVRIERGHKAIALSVDCNARYCFLDPYEGARLAVAECSRNVSCVGATPLGLTDCLNFGNPENPEVMWQFAEATRGLADACRALGVPVVSGNVSLYNETDGQSIHPTPTVAVVGLLNDAQKHVGLAFSQRGDVIALLGRTQGHLGGSEYLQVLHGRTAGRPPPLDLDAEKRLQAAVRAAIQAGLLRSAHDCAEGGLLVTVAESCLANGGIGATLEGAPRGLDETGWWFGEDASRVVVSLAEGAWGALETLMKQAGVPLTRIGVVGGESLLGPGFSCNILDLHGKWRTFLPGTAFES